MSASRLLMPFFSRQINTSQTSQPLSERKQPDIFCFNFVILISLSVKLLSNGSIRLYINASTSLLCWTNRLNKLWFYVFKSASFFTLAVGIIGICCFASNKSPRNNALNLKFIVLLTRCALQILDHQLKFVYFVTHIWH